MYNKLQKEAKQLHKDELSKIYKEYNEKIDKHMERWVVESMSEGKSDCTFIL